MGVLGPESRLDRNGVVGTLNLVDGDDTELVLIASQERAALFARGDLGDLTVLECIDPTTRLARATTTGAAPVVAVAAEGDPVGLRGLVLVAAQLTGIAEATAALSAEHAKDRIQFGRPIGVNQAVKHPCADMAVRAELAWAQTTVAALAVDEEGTDADLTCLR